MPIHLNTLVECWLRVTTEHHQPRCGRGEEGGARRPADSARTVRRCASVGGIPSGGRCCARREGRYALKCAAERVHGVQFVWIAQQKTQLTKDSVFRFGAVFQSGCGVP
eukprot:3908468-Pyramimonas_sp.AAC.1